MMDLAGPSGRVSRPEAIIVVSVIKDATQPGGTAPGLSGIVVRRARRANPVSLARGDRSRRPGSGSSLRASAPMKGGRGPSGGSAEARRAAGLASPGVGERRRGLRDVAGRGGGKAGCRRSRTQARAGVAGPRPWQGCVSGFGAMASRATDQAQPVNKKQEFGYYT
jgi:hypothetical protein